MRTWHMVAEWLDFDPATSADPDEGEAREEFFSVEAENLSEAHVKARQKYPEEWKILCLDWAEWEPWPGLRLRVEDSGRWQQVAGSPWSGCASILLRDAAPLPEGLDVIAEIRWEQVQRLINGTHRSEYDGGTRISGWRVEGDGQECHLVHDNADALHLQAKNLAPTYAMALRRPRVRSIVSGPHAYAPILGLDEAGEVVVVTIGRKA